uniref:FA core complex associated protein 24 n=1 Tax=Sinocyclocheilus rhinocerous TaxID=307959 RepID=A0A673NR69_9TELE
TEERHHPRRDEDHLFSTGQVCPKNSSNCLSNCLCYSVENKENPFLRKSVYRLLEPVVLSLVLQIPGIGKVKVMQLLQRFPSIHQLSGASVHELEPIVEQATAQHITAFFHNQFT